MFSGFQNNNLSQSVALAIIIMNVDYAPTVWERLRHMDLGLHQWPNSEVEKTGNKYRKINNNMRWLLKRGLDSGF